MIDGWKNRGLDPDQVPPGEAGAFANGKGGELYAAYQERLKTLNAADFGDLLLECLRLLREHPDVLGALPEALPLHPGRRVSGHQRRPVPLAAPARAERAGTSAASATTTSRSMAGAAPRSTTSCASSTTSPARRSSGSSATTARPATSSPPPPALIANNQGRLGKTLCTEDEPGEKVTVTGAWDSEEEARRIGEEIEALHAKQHSLADIAILVRISAQMREFEDRFVTLGLPYQIIGGPRFYERAEIRDALAYLRCVDQPADDLAFERIVNVPKRGLGDATIQRPAQPRPRAPGVPLMQAARYARRDRRAEAEAARRPCAISSIAFGRWAKLAETLPHSELAADRPGRIRLHRHVADGPLGRSRRPPRKPQGARALDGGVPGPAGLPRARLAGHGGERGATAPSASAS